MRPSPLWRGILWVERFLPTPPTPPTPPADPSPAAKRKAVMATQVILLAVVVPSLLRRRHEVGAIIREDHVALEQVVLVLAVCIAVAAFAFGVKAWRDARRLS